MAVRVFATPGMYMPASFLNMAVRDKHLRIDQDEIDRAKRFLGVATEQETIERALDVLLAEEAIVRAHRRVRAVGGFEEDE